MKRSTLLAPAALVLCLGIAAPASARGHGMGRSPGFAHRGFGRPGFSHHPRSRFFIGGSVFFDPFFFPYYYPYYVPYPYPAYDYPPPPEDYEWGAPPPEEAPGAEEERRAEAAPPGNEEETQRASYGLVQLRGIPDGASVDLDGRFWLTAQKLDERWLAMPRGEHTLAVRVRGFDPVERSVDVKPGKNQVVRFGPFRQPAG
jgi:hypothetical protein